MTIIKKNNQNILIIDKHQKIMSAQDLMDHMTDAMYHNKCTAVVVHQVSLSPEFFNLKSGIAGEMLQKCSTYGIKIAIIGEFEKFGSKSLKAFIAESNHGTGVFFKNDMQQGVHALSNPGHP